MEVLKKIPMLGQLVQLAQMLSKFIQALANGDIAGAFKSLLEPLLNIAMSAVLDQIGVGSLISDLGDKLAEQFQNMIPQMTQELEQMGCSQEFIAAFQDRMNHFVDYFKSDLFVQDLQKQLGKDASDLTLNANDLSKLHSSDFLSGMLDTAIGRSISLAAMPSASISADLSKSSFSSGHAQMSGGYDDPGAKLAAPQGSMPGKDVNVGEANA
jgi:hypothetical protein